MCVLSCMASHEPMLQAAAQGFVRHEQTAAAQSLWLWQMDLCEAAAEGGAGSHGG